MPSEVQEILDWMHARQALCSRAEWPRLCRYCDQAEAALILAPLTLRPCTPKVGFFALEQPYQYLPPPQAFVVAVPPLPPRPDAPAGRPNPWRLPFYESNFRYLDQPNNSSIDPFDFIKRIPVPTVEEIVSDFGGEFRWQGRVEDNRRLTGEQNNFNLFREKLFLDTWYWGRFRTFFEVFWADTSEQTVPPVFFDTNHGDFLNAFGELKLLDRDDRTLSARFGGRQQLLFGDQRLVAPLDWANSPRTFDTVANALWRGLNWHLDAFWCRPNIILPRQLDEPNSQQQFFGLYAVYQGFRNQVYDLYYLGFDQEKGPGITFNGEAGDLAIQTFGTRWQGQSKNLLWEGEAAYQFGHHRNLPRSAGMVTSGIGHRFARWPLVPELWFYFDYASGNRRPDGGSFGTFNQLFPFGHKFFGYMDIVGRQNIIAPNVLTRFSLGQRASLLLWYYNFHLASARDALYNAAGTPIRFDPTGRAGRYVGDELDIVLSFVMNPHSDWQIGVSHFWAGPFVQRTANTPAQAEGGLFFYTQFLFRF